MTKLSKTKDSRFTGFHPKVGKIFVIFASFVLKMLPLLAFVGKTFMSHQMIFSYTWYIAIYRYCNMQYINILNQPYCIVLLQEILQYNNISIYRCISPQNFERFKFFYVSTFHSLEFSCKNFISSWLKIFPT